MLKVWETEHQSYSTSFPVLPLGCHRFMQWLSRLFCCHINQFDSNTKKKKETLDTLGFSFLLFAENGNIIAPGRGMELLKVKSILNLWAQSKRRERSESLIISKVIWDVQWASRNVLPVSLCYWMVPCEWLNQWLAEYSWGFHDCPRKEQFIQRIFNSALSAAPPFRCKSCFQSYKVLLEPGLQPVAGLGRRWMAQVAQHTLCPQRAPLAPQVLPCLQPWINEKT